ncbi:DUF2382 domain-containing protein [Actinophytocola sp. NPDC049390]|uniref:DUF2382 domain-containing protein n=1 Tax=Actinophytocola sp. NPDC049390 TaxID=3363894 RepID=UPI00378C45F4
MIAQNMVNQLYDCQVVDPRGEKIGAVKRVWLDGRTGDPLWASVHTGLFGLKESFVPLQRAELRNDQLQVPVDKEQVKDSPRIEATHDHMTDEEQAALYRHYGFGPQGGAPGQTSQRQTSQRQTTQRQTSQRRPGSSLQPEEYPGRGREHRGDPRSTRDDAMTRSEERLNVGTEQVETGKVRLVKHVVTEQQQVQVPVKREEARLEREPITDANRGDAMRGKDITEAEHEMTLHAERPVVKKETEPVERVRLAKEEVTDTETVSDTVRKEQIDLEDGRSRDDRRRRS